MALWTEESRKAFNLAMQEALADLDQRKIAELGQWAPERVTWLKQRTEQLIARSQGIEDDAGFNYFIRLVAGYEKSLEDLLKKFNEVLTGIRFGLIPITTNPVIIDLLKMYSTDYFILVQGVLRNLREIGYVQIVQYYRGATPAGWTVMPHKIIENIASKRPQMELVPMMPLKDLSEHLNYKEWCKLANISEIINSAERGRQLFVRKDMFEIVQRNFIGIALICFSDQMKILAECILRNSSSASRIYLDKALEAAVKARAADPAIPNYLFKLASLLELSGDLHDAIEFYELFITEQSQYECSDFDLSLIERARARKDELCR